MKNSFLCLLPLILAFCNVNAQNNGCFDNVNTRTTDPKELYAADGKNPNTVYLDAAHTILNPDHFDWTDPTISHQWYWSTNTAIQPTQIFLPYYCNVAGFGNIDGACTNQNTYYYQQLINNMNPAISLHDKNKLFDILPEDGWELMYKRFGSVSTPNNIESKVPTFILYNRYTGKLKVFAAATGLEVGFVGISAANRAALRVSFTANDKTAFFGNAQPISQVLSSYTVSPNQPLDEHYVNNEFVSPNSISQLNAVSSIGSSISPPQYQWLMSEFTVPYDPCTCWNTNIPQLSVNLVYWSNSSINMSGKIIGNLTATPTDFYNGSNINQGNKGDAVATKGNVQNSIEGAMKGYETWSNYAEKIKSLLEDKSGGNSTGLSTTNIQINNVVNSWFSSTGQSGTYTQQQKNTSFYNIVLGGATGKADDGISQFAGFKSVISGVASAVPYVGAFLGLLDSFNGGGQENAVDNTQHVTIDNPSPPTNYIADLKVQLSGKISTENQPVPIFAYVPGSRPSYTIKGPAPTYNNILGVFNLLEQPTVSKTPLLFSNSISYPPVSSNDLPMPPVWVQLVGGYNCVGNYYNDIPDLGNKNFTGFKYKLSTTPKFIINPASNLDIESIDAAIVMEYNNSVQLTELQNLSTLSTQPQIPLYSQLSLKYPSGTSFETKLNNLLSGSGLDLEFISDNYPTASNSIIRFRTKYVPLECLSNIDFSLYGNSSNPIAIPKMYLKVYCKLKRQNNTNSDPVVIVQTFDVSESFINASASSPPYPVGYIEIDPFYDFTTQLQPGNPVYGGGANCYETFDVVFKSAFFHLSLNSNAFNQNVFNTAGLYPTYGVAYQSSMNDIILSNSVPIGNKYVSNKSISFAPNSMPYDIGSTTNTGYYGNSAQLYANQNVNFNGSFNFLSLGTSDVKAAKEIIFTPPSGAGEINISGESTFMIAKSNLILSSLIGCDTPPQITSLLASSSSIDGVCSLGGSLRLTATANPTNNSRAEGAVNNPALVKSSIKSLEALDYKIGIYPNPTTGNLPVNFFSGAVNNVIISLEDVTGKQLLSQATQTEQGYSSNQLNLQEFANGIYLLKITNATGQLIKTEKVILNR
ncbi:MAG: T9SS type A sorting domain-containing protein [Bacteroidetes bacterium]|nr:T9SS type A sorting domain-containing protein [Bacteroidota bacterium]